MYQVSGQFCFWNSAGWCGLWLLALAPGAGPGGEAAGFQKPRLRLQTCVPLALALLKTHSLDSFSSVQASRFSGMGRPLCGEQPDFLSPRWAAVLGRERGPPWRRAPSPQQPCEGGVVRIPHTEEGVEAGRCQGDPAAARWAVALLTRGPSWKASPPSTLHLVSHHLLCSFHGFQSALPAQTARSSTCALDPACGCWVLFQTLRMRLGNIWVSCLCRPRVAFQRGKERHLE